MSDVIHGFCEARFKPLEAAFRANFEAGQELGASLGVTWRGRMVVDLWSGWAARDRTKPWTPDTVVPVASTTKLMTTIAALMVVDRGLLELDAPVARYWPEFAQGGKAAVTVRDVFTHQCGVPGLEPVNTFADLLDWQSFTARLAGQPHWFDGRRRIIYHFHTYGFILGELIRRVDGRQPGRFFREEVAERASADFQIGLTSRADMDRLAQITPLPAPHPMEPGSLLERLFKANAPPRTDGLTWEAFSADLPSGGGVANGRSIARACAILAMRGTLDGVRYLSAATVDEAARPQAKGVCPYLGPITFGLGMGLSSDDFRLASPTCYGWGGTGGSWAIIDPRPGLSLGYAPNNWSVEWEGISDPRHEGFSNALNAILADLPDVAAPDQPVVQPVVHLRKGRWWRFPSEIN